VHPSSLLRADDADRDGLPRQFAADLSLVHDHLG
jgi:hypothetical protein